MNIFYLDKCPEKAARLQYNKHVVKMILESAQMLCTAHHELLDDPDVPYKPAHINHPSTIWTRTDNHHYHWLYEHMLALGGEYTKRYGKEHLSITKCKEPLRLAPINIPHVEFKQPPQCMPDEYKDECSIQAYWNYYIGEKHIVANLKTEKLYDQRPKETY
jgi:hypothetical protein